MKCNKVATHFALLVDLGCFTMNSGVGLSVQILVEISWNVMTYYLTNKIIFRVLKWELIAGLTGPGPYKLCTLYV